MPTNKKQSLDLATLSLIFGVVAVVPFLGWGLGPVAVILGIIALVKATEKQLFAILGIVFGVILPTIATFVVFAMIGSAASNAVITEQYAEYDEAHKEDLAELLEGIDSYRANNRGSMPTKENWNTFLTRYISSQVSGANNFILDGIPKTAEDIGVNFSSTCGNGGAVVSGGSRDIAFRIILKADKSILCVDNN